MFYNHQIVYLLRHFHIQTDEEIDSIFLKTNDLSPIKILNKDSVLNEVFFSFKNAEPRTM